MGCPTQLVDLDVSEYVLLRSLTAAHNLLTEPLLWQVKRVPASSHVLSYSLRAPLTGNQTLSSQTLPQTLTHLDVSYNTLAALPTLRGLPHLRILNVAHNRLQDVRGAAECPTLHVVRAPLWNSRRSEYLHPGTGPLNCR
jgi:Leucine-rich repeat (LRR) protein